MKRSIQVLKPICALSLSLVAVSAIAEEDGWTGKGEAGISIVGGNSESEIITAGLEIGKKVGKWEHSAELSILKSESEVIVDGARETQETADSLLVGWLSKYTFSKRAFAYGDLRYLDDEFDSFEDVTTVSAGAGYKVLMREDVKWDVSLGLGYRDTEYDLERVTLEELEDAGLEQDIGEATLVATSKYENQLTDTTKFTNNTRIEGASDNSYAQNVSALTVKMNAALALSLKHDVRHNTDPAPGTTSTDRITSFNVVYSF